MLKNSHVALTTLLCCGAVTAQSTFVVPSAFATTAGNSSDAVLTVGRPGQHPVRQQVLWNTSDIAIPAAVLQSMELRASPSLRTGNPVATLTMSLALSVGPNSAETASSTFAANLGSVVVTAFNGPLNLPAQTTGPSPMPWSVMIPFTAPFPYIPVQGQSLVADFDATSYVTAGTDSWVFDAATTVTITPGQRVSNGNAQSNCRFSTGNYNNSLSSRPPIRGAIWYVSYGNVPANAPVIGVLGGQGIGGTYGGQLLPFNLGPLGAPNCTWNVDVLVTVPFVTNASGQARWPDIPVPNDPGVVGAQFFDQGLVFDPPANAFGLVPTWSSRWTVGDATHPEGARVYQYQNTNNSPTGTLDRTALIAKFNH